MNLHELACRWAVLLVVEAYGQEAAPPESGWSASPCKCTSILVGVNTQDLQDTNSAWLV